MEFPNVDEGDWGLLQGQDKAPYQATSDVNTGYFWLSGYEVGYRTDAESDWKSATSSKNTVTIKGLTAGKACQVRARGFVEVDGEKHYGEWGEAITSGEVKAGSAGTAKAANPLIAKGKTIKVKQAKLKKKARSFKRSRAIKVGKAQGAVTYKKLSGNKKIVVNAKTGKVKVKKGLKKKTYKVKIRVSAAGNAKYAKGSKTIVVKVRVS